MAVAVAITIMARNTSPRCQERRLRFGFLDAAGTVMGSAWMTFLIQRRHCRLARREVPEVRVSDCDGPAFVITHPVGHGKRSGGGGPCAGAERFPRQGREVHQSDVSSATYSPSL